MKTINNPSSGINILLYAPVIDQSMLKQGFYLAETNGLMKDRRIKSVRVTNKLRQLIFGDHDAVITYFYSYSAFAAIISFMRRKAIIATGGGEQIIRSMAPNFIVYLIRIILFITTLLFVKKVFATSSTDYFHMKRIAPFRSSNIEISFHGTPLADNINLDLFSDFRDSFHFVTICGMDTVENVKRKGIFRAIRLISKLRSIGYDATLTIIGRTTRADIVFEEARRLNCESAIFTTGYISEEMKFSILRSCRYYIQLSEYEGFGIGALEALASGCIVIHSGQGGLQDSIADYGIVLKDHDIDNFDISMIDVQRVYGPEQISGHLAMFSEIGRAKILVDGILDD